MYKKVQQLSAIAPLLIVLLACNQKSDTPPSPSSKQDVATIPYTSALLLWQKNCNEKNRMRTIADSIIPYWYGTAWNFYGTSTTPQEGSIACGYFVTTIVQHSGKNVQRIKLAQQPASTIINTLCQPRTIKRYAKLSELEKYLSSLPNNTLCIIGLDCHTGFVYHTNDHNYFLHSSYVAPQVVKKEELAKALPIRQSKSYMIGVLNPSK